VIDAYCSQPQYARHLLPIWEALPSEHRGTLYVSGRLLDDAGVMAAGAKPKDSRLMSRGPRVLVASHIDYQAVSGYRRVILAQHGAGQSYGADSDPGVNRCPSYAGGDNQDRVDLFLVPGLRPAQRTRERYPHTPVAEIGCPVLDRWLLNPPQPMNAHPIVALAWHWENQLCPETRSALPHFKSALADLTSRYTVIGHAHPRARNLVSWLYDSLGIVWADYETVMTSADVLCTDNSSVGFEAMAVGKPVVWMTPPWYRDVDHGIRFGHDFHSRPYLEAREPWQLVPAVGDALRGYGRVDMSHVYTHMDGRSAERAAAAIVALDEEADAMRLAAGVTP